VPLSISLALLIALWALWPGQPTFPEATMTDPIPAVKEFASKLASPPRLYATSGQATPLWPDQQGTITVAGMGPSGIGTPMRHPGLPDLEPPEMTNASNPTVQLITIVEPGKTAGETTIVLALSWSADGKDLRHAWRFHMGGDGAVSFIAEEGDPLPALPM